MLIGDDRRIEPVPGRDLVSTLDAQLQLIVQEALEGHPSGAVVALDPSDGSVRAMYSKPSFNSNAWSGRLSQMEKTRADNDPFKPMLDKTVRPYFPGSIFKIAGSYAGLDTGTVEPDDEVDCHGAYRYGGTLFRCWKWGGHGSVDLRAGLQHSCDVYFYKLAEQLGIDTIANYASRFGFGERTGFPVNDERSGRVPTREWHRQHSPNGYQPGFALNTIIGQGDTRVTPLQVALAYGAIANGGRVHYPRLVEAVKTGRGQTLFEFPARVRKRLQIDEADLDVIRDGLWRVVNKKGGTAYSTRLEDIEFSGKTGTAQVHSSERVHLPNREKAVRLRDHAWFVGYAPSDDPELVVAVFLEHAGHGGRTAAPVASEIFDRYLHRDKRPSLSRKIGHRYRRETDVSATAE
jgi:penicillin-binding protein 2